MTYFTQRAWMFCHPEMVQAIDKLLFAFSRNLCSSCPDLIGCLLLFLSWYNLWVKFPEFEPKEQRGRGRPTQLSPVASRNLITQPHHATSIFLSGAIAEGSRVCECSGFCGRGPSSNPGGGRIICSSVAVLIIVS